ncbi:BA75_01597T0 [Komagataella pastoris]|uniref:BA75_01597T0 n=1 Tax=Komagataella pastoris TaxID=4922 RepID=A0A1B2J8S1_PICPA|nr:BA75_01597T0 [Komagataella pastoris]
MSKALPETTHLLHHDPYDKTETSAAQKSSWKNTLYIIFATVVSVPLLYLFLIYLPNLAPESVSELPVIRKVDKLDFSTQLEGPQRLILIGDVHGSLKPLKKLLRKLNYNPKQSTDTVLLLGDFISKGPQSVEVVDLAIKNNFQCILGNHEISVLQRYNQFHGLSGLKYRNNESDIEYYDLQSGQLYPLDDEMRLAKQLYPRHIEYMGTCPFIYDLGSVPRYNRKHTHYKENVDGVAVHAGLNWNVQELYDQDVTEVTEMRAMLPPDFSKATDDKSIPGSVGWAKIWNHWQKNITDGENLEGLKNRKVYYGHHASRGLNVRPYTMGIDTACVKGDRLTAVVITYHKDKIREKLVSVSC